LRQAVASGGGAEGGDGGGEGFGEHHESRQDKASGVVEDGENADAVTGAVGESYGEGGLGVGMPDGVGMGRLETATEFTFATGAATQGQIAGMLSQGAVQAADGGWMAQLETFLDAACEDKERAGGKFFQQGDGVFDALGWDGGRLVF
jgi:hypothetical protein